MMDTKEASYGALLKVAWHAWESSSNQRTFLEVVGGGGAIFLMGLLR